MLRFLAKTFSFLFHPLLMPTWLFSLLMFYFPAAIQPVQAWFLIILLIFGMTFILPLLNLIFFKMTGTIQDFYLEERKDRVLPFIFISIVYAGITAMFFMRMNFPVVFNLMVIVTGLVLLATIATFFFKISVHAIAVGGMAGILLAIVAFMSASELLIPALSAMVLAGLVMSSRLLLNAHELNEVGWGGVLGFVIGFIGVEILF